MGSISHPTIILTSALDTQRAIDKEKLLQSTNSLRFFQRLTDPPFLRLASNALTDLGSVGMIFNYNEPQTQKSGAVWN